MPEIGNKPNASKMTKKTRKHCLGDENKPEPKKGKVLSKRAKINKILQDNRRLKEKLYYLESSVSAFNSAAVSKEDKLQVELEIQNEIEKALEKKIEEVKNAFEESDKCKTISFDKIIQLEMQCQQLKKTIICQDHEIANMKFKYNELKKWDK